MLGIFLTKTILWYKNCKSYKSNKSCLDENVVGEFKSDGFALF